MNQTFPCTGTIRADLRVAAGRLEVVASDRDTATVSVTAMDSSESSAEAVRETKISFVEGRHLLVQAPEHGGWRLFRRARLLVRVELPTGSALSVKVASADAACEGTYHDAVFSSASGDVSLGPVTGDVTVKSSSGDVRLSTVGGHLNASSASGDVRTGHVGRTATVHTASGDVELGGVDGDARVTTASGDIAVGVARSGEARLNSASGDITVGVAAGTGAWLDLSTAAGRTRSDLNMSTTAPPTETTAGTLTLKVRTASGDITLRRVVPA
ncbi:DUF4097 domain-containing protein [Catellatospora coxensis]|uniref:DUF4097 domain-containing protein n=1 Tax=Catellatospora coxensis TaxID=310354 RepID=A0A8J3P8K8_9ACTN|nr:DUF4097 family beta strand repeat-containing protein [Catellatospora coxensis]GIG07594.1 hypothetical protein Cco03nite_42940 [Catellatospora coxensis]